MVIAGDFFHYPLGIFLTLSFPGTPLVLLLTFGHNYANTRPILSVQRPIAFHLVSFERVFKAPRRYSNHSPHGNSYKIMVSDVDPLLFFGIFFFCKNHASHTNKNHLLHDDLVTNHDNIGTATPRSTWKTYYLDQIFMLISIMQAATSDSTSF